MGVERERCVERLRWGLTAPHAKLPDSGNPNRGSVTI